ncbi:hypothetical protein, partial [Pseudomonas aeruginosa]
MAIREQSFHQRLVGHRLDLPAIAQRLAEAGQAYRLVYLQEPGRFRAPRDRWEVEAVADEALVERLFPDSHERRVLL